MSDKVHHLPFELLSEQVAQEWEEKIHRRFGDNPHVIKRLLPVIIQEVAHDCIELGLGLAGVPEVDPIQPIEAYNAGYAQGLKDESERSKDGHSDKE